MKLGLVFALLALGLILPSAYASTASIDVNGNTHEITYEATGLDVDGFEADTNAATLSVFVTTTDVDGILQLTLDRSFFDSKTDQGADEDFFILLDGGTEAEFTDDATESARILTITVPASTISIDVIGTVFGTGETTEETPVEETPVEETPVEETPVEEAPVEETPEVQCGPGTILQDGVCVLEQVEETPVEETPVEEAPVEETPEVSQCGPGTVLKDGECVLDQTCGPGTILKDGTCVLDQSAAPATPSGQGTQFVAAIIGGFIIAFVIMMILWAIGRASRKKN
ncbi:MAG: hypothetical protein HZC29_03330 [Thaumarchaeota archaeon]|nr:hypothetical protein [Nitrososphaerota archaeon]